MNNCDEENGDSDEENGVTPPSPSSAPFGSPSVTSASSPPDMPNAP